VFYYFSCFGAIYVLRSDLQFNGLTELLPGTFTDLGRLQELYAHSFILNGQLGEVSTNHVVGIVVALICYSSLQLNALTSISADVFTGLSSLQQL
jgi:hypothetical protein